MRHPFLIGRRVYLRALEQEDLTRNYSQWLNDEDVCRYNSHAIFPNTAFKMQEYFDFAQTSTTTVVLAVVTRRGDVHIGNVSLQNIDWVVRSAEFAIIIGEKKYWNKGYASESAALIINYAFERLNLNRCHCGTSIKNIGMQRLAEKLGMQKEGVRRSAMYKMGGYVDVVEYGLLREEWKRV
jgi:RimJ/RimL family protein N-acetyltransferase